MNVGYILVILSVAQLVIGGSMVLRNRGNQTAIWYGLFMIGVGLYVGANGFGYLHWLLSQQQAEHLAWTGGALTATFFLPFSFVFPYPKKSVRELLPLVLWPLAIFVPGILWSNAFIIQQAVVNFGNGYASQTGPYFPFFALFFAVYWLWAFVNLFRSYRAADGVHRQQIGIILVGTLLSFAIASYFDIYISVTDVNRVGYIGSLCTSIWFGYTAYVLWKK